MVAAVRTDVSTEVDTGMRTRDILLLGSGLLYLPYRVIGNHTTYHNPFHVSATHFLRTSFTDMPIFIYISEKKGWMLYTDYPESSSGDTSD